MTGHGAKLPRRKEEAIAALLAQPSVTEAARVMGITAQTLGRWMKDPELAAAYRKARRATHRQAIARLQQASGAMVGALLKVMYDPGAAVGARLRAADRVLHLAKTASEMEEIRARVSELKHAREASQRERCANGDGALSAEQRGSWRKAGHGAKFPRKKEAAIAALLTQRSVAEAARLTGIGAQTLYRWIKDEEFAAAWLEAGLAAFGQAGARAQQASGAAVTTILKIAADPGTTAGMRVRAADLALNHARDASEKDIEACVAELECAPPAALTVLPGGRRTCDEIARERPKVAA